MKVFLMLTYFVFGVSIGLMLLSAVGLACASTRLRFEPNRWNITSAAIAGGVVSLWMLT